MAKNIITEITDDLDGSKGATEYSFSFEGTDYTIDLSKKNAAAFEKALRPYLEAATKSARRSTSKRPKNTASRGRDLSEVRAWAQENGIEVSERGRVAKAVLDQFDSATG